MEQKEQKGENKQPTASGEKKPLQLTPAQKKTMKRYGVYTLMGIICLAFLLFIFTPSAADKAKEAQKEGAGLNATLPQPASANLATDKRDAYEQEQMKQKRAERMHSLEEFQSMFGDKKEQTNTSDDADGLALMDEGTASFKRKAGGTAKNGNSSGSAIRSSAQAYQSINRSLGSFYEEPAKEDAEKERLKAQLEELKARLDENEKRQSDKQEQLDLMEKSYQMAAKYLPGGTSANGMPAANAEQASSGIATEGTKRVNGKLIAMPVSGVRERVVSALPQQTTDEEVLAALSRGRNMGFLTAAGTEQTVEKNTLAAAVYSDQTVMDGQSVRLRLLEAMRVGTMTVPAGTLLSGTAKVQGERLGISVNLLEYQGTILPVELAVFDSDGQRGIFIPDLQSVNAAKEIVANMGTNVGTNISLSSDAGSQLAADMGRSLIQGTSQYVAKKLREVKVHLKAGYRLLLISEERLKND